jgi:hypothetical protein
MLTNLFVGFVHVYLSKWLLITLPSPISELQHAPSTPLKCWELRSMPRTPNLSVVSILRLSLNLPRGLGARQGMWTKCLTIIGFIFWKINVHQNVNLCIGCTYLGVKLDQVYHNIWSKIFWIKVHQVHMIMNLVLKIEEWSPNVNVNYDLFIILGVPWNTFIDWIIVVGSEFKHKERGITIKVWHIQLFP